MGVRIQKKISIVTVTYNASASIVKFLDSVESYTDLPYELIIIDNNSTDGTVAYLKYRSIPHSKILYNETNLGYSKATNMGIKIAKGDYIVLLNPDTVLTPHWASHLLYHFTASSVGAVGAISNYAGGEQNVNSYYTQESTETVPNLDAFAMDVYRKNKRQSKEVKVLIGFCEMIRKEVVDKIGLLDETFFFGHDDLDYSWRMRLAGYRLLVAKDVFIHHKATRNKAYAAKVNQYTKESERQFREKVSKFYKGNPPSSKELFNVSWAFGDEATLAVNIIAKDEETNLPYLLADLLSATPIDEIVVVDTGSSDHTYNIAKGFGVKVGKFKWTGSFADARNYAKSMTTSDYILWLDADDRIQEDAVTTLSALKPQLSPDHSMGVLLELINLFNNKTPTKAWQMRLFPNIPEVYWEGEIHEQVTQSMVKAGVKVFKAHVPIRHLGYYTEDQRKWKAARNLSMLLGKNGDGTAADYYNLSASFFTLDDYKSSIAYARKSIEMHDKEWSKYSLYVLADAYGHKLGMKKQAIKELKKGLEYFPDDSMLLYILGSLCIETGREEEGEEYYRQIQTTGLQQETYPLPINMMERIEERIGKIEQDTEQDYPDAQVSTGKL